MYVSILKSLLYDLNSSKISSLFSSDLFSFMLYLKFVGPVVDTFPKDLVLLYSLAADIIAFFNLVESFFKSGPKYGIISLNITWIAPSTVLSWLNKSFK